jgi:alpha-galactosidase
VNRPYQLLATITVLAAPVLAMAAEPPAEPKPAPDYTSRILTPPPPAMPRINGAKVYGQRPGRPFLYTIPATGERPMTFAADGLPAGLTVDGQTGRITGTAPKAGDCAVTLRVTNSKGTAEKQFKIVIGDRIALTPPMGWNSWNCWAGAVDQDKVLRSARAMAKSGLVNHGWAYVNIDDTWQGTRDPQTKSLQGNQKFPDMKKLCDEIHALGLKPGIYSTPWITSYARYPGGSADNPEGAWEKPTVDKKGRVNNKTKPWHMGDYRFATNDAKQWAAWGFDYLKYDWNPIEEPEVKEIHDALLASGRDIVLSLSNNLPFERAVTSARYANAWRTTGDIRDNWYSVSGIGFAQSKWAPYAGPGHWNDPDMLVVGYVGWGPKLHPTGLTADEQYTHVSLWCLLSAPLLIGCDLERLDAFTISLLTNDEVLAINQDALGKPATLASSTGGDVKIERTDGRDGKPRELPRHQVWAKQLEDGSLAVGLFNLADSEESVTARFADLKLTGRQTVRDLWRQRDLATVDNQFEAPVPPHGVVLVKLTPAK